MLATQAVEVSPEPTIQAVSAKTLRQWCAPEVILVLTNLYDETLILPHAIQQARKSGAKIVLAHVVTPEQAVSVGRKPLLPRPISRLQEARSIVERMARHLRWLGFTCEPLVLTGHPHSVIPLMARNCCVDRAIVTGDDNFDRSKTSLITSAAKLDVPICVIGEHVSLASSIGLPTRNMTLAVSLDSNCNVPLAFASRFAQELRAKLTILHVINRGSGDVEPATRTPIAIASRLPSSVWREAELFCPTEIKIREGDAAEEILKHGASTNQDLMILCSPGISSPISDWRNSVTSKVLDQAKCPIFVLPKELENANNNDALVEVLQKVSAYGERVEGTAKKEECNSVYFY